jgi:DNA primase
MEIHDIKNQLLIQTVLSHYNLTPDRNNRLCCPWHSDKTPSLQIYPKTNTWTCFSSKCDAGSGDTIEMIQRMEKCTKHEALKKAKDLLGHTTIKKEKTKPQENTSTSSVEPLDEIFIKLKANYKRSPKAQAYAKNRMIQDEELGYNGGSWQHLKQCIIFPLRNEVGDIVGLYGRSIIGTDKNKHYYLKNRSGLYPNHPSEETEILTLTESIIDSVHVPPVAGQRLGAKLAMYGTNGLTSEHIESIQSLKYLKEIILFFDGDEAGDAAIQKVGKKLIEIKPGIKISYVETPRDTDINSLVVNHPNVYLEVIKDLIENRVLLSSIESGSPDRQIEESVRIPPSTHNETSPSLNTSNKHNLKYRTENATYSIKGGITKNNLDAMKVTLVIEIEGSHRKSRNKLDLYEDKQVDKISREAAEKLNIEASEIEKDLNRLTDLLDEYREAGKQIEKPIVPIMDSREREQCLTFLKKPNLIKSIDKLIEKSGVIGEESNRINLFCIAASHKMPQTLHALVQGSSGSGKTHLLKQITNLMPVENVIRLTRVTESSFYNYGETELRGKLIVIEDYDGLKEEAEYAFRELQSNEEIISSTSVKDERSGEIRASIRKVKGPIGSLSATTRSEIYEDNLSRCFVIAVDESSQQTHRIIKYQNQVSAGIIDKAKQEKVVRFLGNCMRLLKPI